MSSFQDNEFAQEGRKIQRTSLIGPFSGKIFETQLQTKNTSNKNKVKHFKHAKISSNQALPINKIYYRFQSIDN